MTISFNNLGHLGRLGNQMFQYASLKGISKNNNYQYSIPHNTSLDECFKIPKTCSNHNEKLISIQKYEFDETFFNTCPDNVDIFGFFQSEKYFKHIEDEIRKDFTFHDRINKICYDYKRGLFPNTELISLHVRRTDYQTDTNFECLSLNYYYYALTLLPDLPIIIFSDDVEWCKKYFTNSKFIISLSKNSYIDLCLMSMCDYHIIANSSFSWWGSWLAKSKTTIAPQKWFSGEYVYWNTKDLYLPDWVLI